MATREIKAETRERATLLVACCKCDKVLGLYKGDHFWSEERV